MGHHDTERRPSRRLQHLLGAGVAGVAAAVGTHIAIAGGGILGYDAAVYRAAAAAMLGGETPYHAAQLTGPIPAIDVDALNFLYPPIVAQALAPLALVPMGVAQVAWLTLNLVAWLAAGLIVLRATGRTPTPLAAGLLLAAAFVFRPMLMSLASGNVGGLMALVIAAALAFDPRRSTAGAAAAVGGTVLKVVPVMLLPAQLVRGGRPVLRAMLVFGVPLLLVSAALAPEAWRQYPAVVTNLAAGDVDFAGNLAPSTSALVLGLPELAEPMRAANLVVAALAVAGSLWLATRPDGWPGAVALAVAAMLLGPGMIWPHYYAMAAPLMLVAGLRAGWGGRCLLAGAAGGLGLVWSDPLLQPLSAAAGLLALGASAVLLRPRRAGTARDIGDATVG